jgi:hypothetical protein
MDYRRSRGLHGARDNGRRWLELEDQRNAAAGGELSPAIRDENGRTTTCAKLAARYMRESSPRRWSRW